MKKRKLKKSVIITSTILLLVVGSIGYNVLFKKDKKEDEIILPRTVTLQKDTLNQTISVAGTLKSNQSSNVNSLVATAKITSITVKEGDFVKKGQVLFTLDSSNLDTQIENERENIANQVETAQEAYDNAVLGKDRGWAKYDQARKDRDAACNAATSAKSGMDASSSTFNEVQSAYNEAVNSLNIANEEHNKCLAGLTNQSNSQPEISAEPTTTPNCILEYNKLMEATKILNEKKAALDAVKLASGYDGYSTTYQTQKALCDQLSSAYDTIDIQQQGLEAQVSATRERLEDLQSGTSDLLENLLKQKQDYTITAPIDGVITSLNATINNLPTGVLATIQDVNNLVVECNIEEYDIQSIKKDMDVLISSDANDAIYQGYVDSIGVVSNSESNTNNTLNQVSNSTGNSVTFPISVKFKETPNLLVGMNTNVEIILDSFKDGYIVPLDAIETIDNKTYVYKLNEDNTFSQIEVTIELTNDYYASITSDNLNENDMIQASLKQEESLDFAALLGSGI